MLRISKVFGPTSSICWFKISDPLSKLSLKSFFKRIPLQFNRVFYHSERIFQLSASFKILDLGSSLSSFKSLLFQIFILHRSFWPSRNQNIAFQRFQLPSVNFSTRVSSISKMLFSLLLYFLSTQIFVFLRIKAIQISTLYSSSLFESS